MYNIYGLIIAAGKQTRFDSDIPKALVDVDGVPLLDRNIENMQHFCDKVYVVVSHENKEWFEKYNTLVVNGGGGCGYAVLQALQLLVHTADIKYFDTVLIQWGDAYNEPDVYFDAIRRFTGEVVVPVQWEESPYVRIIEGPYTIKAEFSKYGEVDGPGYHDMSVFYGRAYAILSALQKCILEKLNYDKHGNELQFLDIFNCTDIEAVICFEENRKSFSFNTLEEYSKISI